MLVPRRTRAAVRRELAEDEFDQRRLAGAVRADQAEAIAAHDAHGKVANDGAVAEATSRRRSVRRPACRSARPNRA